MDEYIKREAAINAALLAKSDADITLVPGSFTNGFIEGAKIKENAILNALTDVPAADVRPVVLCRDCQSHNKPRLGFCETHLVRMHGDDFCSYGKKREER